MQVKSFIDVISTDPAYETYMLVTLAGDELPSSGWGNVVTAEYFYSVCGQSDECFCSSSLQETQEFRERVTTNLEMLSNIILIDQTRGKIFTNITNDQFFDRLVQNLSYQVESLAENPLKEIVEKAFLPPLLKQETQKGANCTLV